MSDTAVEPATKAASVLETIDDGTVRILMLNRPDKLNALDTELTQALHDSIVEADHDPSVRALVLSGSGRGFCAGADLAEFSDLTPSHSDAVARRADLTLRTQMLPQQISKPIVAVAQGAAVGGGAGLAIACDMLVAASDIKFGYPEIKHGIVPALVMTGIQRQLGRKLAFELISTGRFLNANELLEHGLANEVAPPADALERGVAIARAWALYSSDAMRSIKELFYRVADLPFDSAMKAGRDVNQIMRSYRVTS
ncbi:enoyl-CoA hydratase/isomerase family protein [Rhodococcus fascians]|uniref:enoyl-CoA hydratase/isomerase family protein n=1 Tax=Rhodococcoides fascians TaxID=1828 RepID=UPI00195BC58D|nr:enoyl-CoA hydratase/isomerase family protein [Rhodococcus fascians]MBM7242536.1 enoyl-CoA hydratase/isomerase family protein [Rhodococcus fascians]MBY3812008.1 enoyl-CoA hydratase/isomerase family protein [Rhodococcus fascians]MBY3840684.1 enoyl-CoA hydratase/isomerase family protein [Rhodococcus fascians]MBY3848184.1 enoyl-CoA hydratase/isomerase family protein [Rhodococcus fascians]MBY3853305.1 enoyl-CoA hydratase/isomerase family protein [Rhodococcus fascians]